MADDYHDHPGDVDAPLVEQTARHVRQLMQGEATGHDWWHTERVWKMARHIARHEQADLLVVELAALLHDIADWKFHDGDETAGPRAARNWLLSLGADLALIDRVCHIVQYVSFKGALVADAIRSREGMIVQDADRLDALGAIGIARAFAYGGWKQRPIHDPATEQHLHADFEAYRSAAGTTINHFYEKLLLLKERLHTETARNIAEQRHQFMLQFLERFYQEWEGTDHATATVCAPVSSD
jgi:uncharacterized protein